MSLDDIPNELNDRNLLDVADKRLHTACFKQNVLFEWPHSHSGQSCDESEADRQHRRQTLRKLLEQARRGLRRLPTPLQIETPIENSNLDIREGILLAISILNILSN